MAAKPGQRPDRSERLPTRQLVPGRSSMKAALIARYGGNDLVKVVDTDVPGIGPLDLLVRVHAASVNPVDVKTRAGQLKTLLKYRFPLVLGNDLSGVVAEAGAQVTRFKKGDAVYARLDHDR